MPIGTTRLLIVGLNLLAFTHHCFGEHKRIRPQVLLPWKKQLAHITLRTSAREDSQTASCSGILVTKNLVLTNAHCFDPLNKKAVYPDNVSFPFADKTHYSIHSFASHPEYLNNTSFYKDIAWIKLESPVDSHDLEPATFSIKQPTDQTKIYFVGYTHQTLNVYDAQLITPTKSILQAFSSKEESLSLYLAFSNGQALARPGDSGGPVYVKDNQGWQLFGLILENSSCFTPYVSTTFIKLDYFREWIEASSQILLSE